MKKLSDEMQAGIFCFVWEAFMYLGLFVEMLADSYMGWFIFLVDTAIQATMLVYSAKVSHLEKQIKRTRKRLAEQSESYVEYVRAHDRADLGTPHPKVISIERFVRNDRKKKRA